MKSLEQKLLKPPLALRCNSVNRAFASARDLLPRFWRDISRFDQLPHGIIKDAGVDVGVALDQSVIQPPFNSVEAEVTAMKYPEDLDRRGVGTKIMADLRF